VYPAVFAAFIAAFPILFLIFSSIAVDGVSSIIF